MKTPSSATCPPRFRCRQIDASRPEENPVCELFYFQRSCHLPGASAVHGAAGRLTAAMLRLLITGFARNAGPGECGCFGTNGGGVSGSWNFHGAWSAVVDISAEHTGSAPPLNNSLTLVSYLAGARYAVPQPWFDGRSQTETVRANHPGCRRMPAVEWLGLADGSYGFATRIGGGIDVPLNRPLRGARDSD